MQNDLPQNRQHFLGFSAKQTKINKRKRTFSKFPGVADLAGGRGRRNKRLGAKCEVASASHTSGTLDFEIGGGSKTLDFHDFVWCQKYKKT